MNLWGKLLNRCDRHRQQCLSAWHYRRFLLCEKPRHRLVEMGGGVKFNVPVRGGSGTLRIGARSVFGYPLAQRYGSGEILLQARAVEAEIVLGCDNWFNNNSALCAMQSIRVGDHCRIGDCVTMVDCDFHELDPKLRNTGVGPVRPIVIGNNVWIGSRAMILKGVTVGDNSVIGAMSLVTKDVPANCVAAGVPAQVIRKLE